MPYIYEDRVSEEDFVKALETVFNMPDDKRKKMALDGREYVSKKYGFESFNKRWVEIMDQVVEENGSWDTRKNYERWSLQEVK